MQKVINEKQKQVAEAWCKETNDVERVKIANISSQLTAVSASLFWLQHELKGNPEVASMLGFTDI